MATKMPPNSLIANELQTKGFYFLVQGYGKSINLPDFYETAYHSDDYIRREWSKYFEVVEIRTLGAVNRQDSVLLRKV